MVEVGFGSQVWVGVGKLAHLSYYQFSWNGSLEIYLYGVAIFQESHAV
jgi:hypothetical protein